MKYIIGVLLALLAGYSLVNMGWNSALFLGPASIVLIMMVTMFRNGWTYVETARTDGGGKQREFDEDGHHYIVKDGVTYRQDQKQCRTSGYDWAEPSNWKKRNSSVNVNLQRRKRR